MCRLKLPHRQSRGPLDEGGRDARAQPVCDFCSATFERLFQVRVRPSVQVVQTHREARGDPLCRFALRW